MAQDILRSVSFASALSLVDGDEKLIRDSGFALDKLNEVLLVIFRLISDASSSTKFSIFFTGMVLFLAILYFMFRIPKANCNVKNEFPGTSLYYFSPNDSTFELVEHNVPIQIKYVSAELFCFCFFGGDLLSRKKMVICFFLPSLCNSYTEAITIWKSMTTFTFTLEKK